MRRAISAGSAIRPTPHSPSAVSPSSGPDELDAPLEQDLRIRPGRRVQPHTRVHRRRNEHRPAMSERCLGDEVVGDPVGELRERVRRARCDDEQLGPGEMGVEVLASGTPRERLKGLGPHEAVGAGREQRDHVVPALHEQARQLARLVGGDAAADP